MTLKVIAILSCIFGVFSSLACNPHEASHKRWEFLDAHEACYPTLSQQLESWGATDEVFQSPPTPGLVRSHRIATGQIGVWISIAEWSDGTTFLDRRDQIQLQRVAVDSSCNVTSSIESIEPTDNTFTFSDADLETELHHAASEGAATVIYVWSPHMPLSVDGYRQIAAVAEQVNLRLVPVLFGTSDRAFAIEEANRVGIPDNGLRELRSVELIFRDAHVHAPTILVFADGRVSPALPGYRNTLGYRRFIEDFLRQPAAKF